MSFTVQGQHVIVVGAGRSGIAAAELLVGQGARVTLSDLHEPEGGDALRNHGAILDIGPHRTDVFSAADGPFEPESFSGGA